MSQDKPVAAQEPIAWMHGTAGRFEVIHAEVKKLWERVGQPAQFAKEVVSCKVENYTIPLYSHAAQCARCAELEEMHKSAAFNAKYYKSHYEALSVEFTEQAAEIELYRAEISAAREVGFYSAQELYMAYANQAAEIERLKREDFSNERIQNESLKLANKVQAERIKALEEHLERERMRLAACGVVALANTPESAAKHREMLPEYESGSLESVKHIVDSEMALRNRLAKADAVIGVARDALVTYFRTFKLAEKAISAIEAYRKGEEA